MHGVCTVLYPSYVDPWTFHTLIFLVLFNSNNTPLLSHENENIHTYINCSLSHQYVKLAEHLKLTEGLKLTEHLKLAQGLKSAVM